MPSASTGTTTTGRSTTAIAAPDAPDPDSFAVTYAFVFTMGATYGEAPTAAEAPPGALSTTESVETSAPTVVGLNLITYVPAV